MCSPIQLPNQIVRLPHPASTTKKNLVTLPQVLVIEIFSFCSSYGVIGLSKTCKVLNLIGKNENLVWFPKAHLQKLTFPGTSSIKVQYLRFILNITEQNPLKDNFQKLLNSLLVLPDDPSAPYFALLSKIKDLAKTKSFFNELFEGEIKLLQESDSASSYKETIKAIVDFTNAAKLLEEQREMRKRKFERF